MAKLGRKCKLWVIKFVIIGLESQGFSVVCESYVHTVTIYEVLSHDFIPFLVAILRTLHNSKVEYLFWIVIAIINHCTKAWYLPCGKCSVLCMHNRKLFRIVDPVEWVILTLAMINTFQILKCRKRVLPFHVTLLRSVSLTKSWGLYLKKTLPSREWGI